MSTPNYRRNRGILMLVFSILPLMSTIYFINTHGFIKGIRTYFWDSGVGIVISNDLRDYGNSGGGEVEFLAMINGIEIKETSEVYEKFWSDEENLFIKFSKKYRVGQNVQIFYSGKEMSLGHWPTEYSYSLGLTYSLISLMFFLRLAKGGLRRLKHQ